MRRHTSWLTIGGLMLTWLAFLWANQWRWPDDSRYLWQTPDQVGAEAFAEGDYPAARAHFHSPPWQAIACYRAGDYPCAIRIAATLTSAEAAFLTGNAHARMHDARRAEQAFAQAMERRPGWPAAQANRDLMRLAIARQQRKPDSDAPDGEPNEPPDGSVVDNQAKRGKRGQIAIEKLDANALDIVWLRNVRTDPAAFLRLRFAREAPLRATGESR